MGDDVKYIIDADDKASAKFKNLKNVMAETAKETGKFGSQAKTTSEGVKQLADMVGATNLSPFIGQSAMAFDAVNKLSSGLQLGTDGLAIFRGGLVLTAAVMVAQGVNAYLSLLTKQGELNAEYTRWIEIQRKGADAQSESVQRANVAKIATADTTGSIEEQRKALVKLHEEITAEIRVRDAAAQSNKAYAASWTAWGKSFFTADGGLPIEQAKANQEIQEKLIGTLEQQKKQVEEKLRVDKEALHVAENNKIIQENVRQLRIEEERRANASYDAIVRETEMLQMGAEAYARREHLRAAEAVGTEELAKQSLAELDAVKAEIAEREAIAEMEKQQKASEEQRLRTTQSVTEQLRMQVLEMTKGKEEASVQRMIMQGVEESVARQIVTAQMALEGMNRQADAIPKAGVQASESRLLSGRGVPMEIEKADRQASAERDKMRNATLKQLENLLEQIDAKIGRSPVVLGAA